KLKTCLDDYSKDKASLVDRTILTLNGDMIGGCLLFSLDKGASMLDICNEIG
ncbi:unnamed protein product, partial [Amoebophrya sp. A25]